MKFNPVLHKLSNGTTVILDPMDIETVNVKVQFRTGARDEQPHEYGLTHFCEHMLCKGTARFPTQKIGNDYIGYNAGTKNASTGHFQLSFYGHIVADNLNILIDFFGDQIQNSLILPEKIDIERNVISDELLCKLNKQDSQMQEFISKTLFGGRVGSVFKTLGSSENIANFSRDQILEFLSRRLSAKNCVIGISGKINDMDSTLKCLEKTFGWLPSHDVPENMDIEYKPSFAHNSKSNNSDTKLHVYFPCIWDRAFENRFNSMCVDRFERYMKDELYEILRHENGWVYGFSGAGQGNEKFELTGFSTSTSADNIEKLIASLAQHSYRIYTENKITDDDLERYRRNAKLSWADWLESPSSRCDRLINFYCDHGRLYDYENTIKMFNSITRDDVIKNSRGYFDGQMSIITHGADYTGNLKEIWEENFKSKSRFPKNPEFPKVKKENKKITPGEKCR